MIPRMALDVCLKFFICIKLSEMEYFRVEETTFLKGNIFNVMDFVSAMKVVCTNFLLKVKECHMAEERVFCFNLSPSICKFKHLMLSQLLQTKEEVELFNSNHSGTTPYLLTYAVPLKQYQIPCTTLPSLHSQYVLYVQKNPLKNSPFSSLDDFKQYWSKMV